MMKTNKIIYYIATSLLTLLMFFSVGMYLFNNAEITKGFISFGFPTYLIYPLAFLKIAGLVTIWFISNRSLKEWAYAGFFFNFVLAFFAHYMISDGEHIGAVIAIVLVLVSYFYSKKIKTN
ncbi:DoxX family protein [uncultured Polaribacter sp.]|uniref:DoxX family protein n=1 Tax=uncultured Polaribacter sp. TaxID=174711 RepID=UPI0026263F62|nr:DoxX family protein [uncultured Polaribacter sp.]